MASALEPTAGGGDPSIPAREQVRGWLLRELDEFFREHALYPLSAMVVIPPNLCRAIASAQAALPGIDFNPSVRYSCGPSRCVPAWSQP